MRHLLLLLSLFGLVACASPLPKPDAQKAWVDVQGTPSALLMAHTLDGLDLRDGRFFQVPPGKHELVARLQFEVGYLGGGDLGGGPKQITCYLRVRYDNFVAGQRYRLEGRPQLMKAQGWLYDDQRNILARATVQRCGSF
ncbi:PA0061/PA0062 family lipoprotein [Aquipseudomonas ullengensis]|uniref:Lipoprotein n=1 Tax=Aquipseudomonas ullengensis TaxID=2759166 RepID=A0A7W4LJI0_9GAMM|nr:hypothetical protein [Pseudomonas ullengensis]MBB2494333.1 hypothetical protein [Pseudomonas ullengensis]